MTGAKHARRPTPAYVGVAAALAIVGLLVLTGGGPSQRTTSAEVVGTTLMARVPSVVRFHVLRRE